VAESLELLGALLVTGVLFGGIAAMWLAPRLYGKIEPLMGLRPRDPQHPPRLSGPWGVSFWLVAALGIAAAGAVGVLSQWEDFAGREDAVTTFGSFDTEAVDTYGASLGWIAAVVGLVVGLAIVVAIAAATARRRRSASQDAPQDGR